MTQSGRTVLLTCAMACSLLCALAHGTWATEQNATADDAARLYEQGQYAEAGELLTRLDAQEDLGGASLYRLYYCQTVQQQGDARTTLQRAIERLQAEAESGRPALEPSFYLANAYSNVAKLSAAAEVASKATAAVEAGRWPQPSSGADSFRLGKLYADQENKAKAIEWFQKAVPLLQQSGESGAAYLRWAHRYLSEQAEAAGSPEAAADQLAAMLQGDKGTQAQFDRLAVMQSTLGRYAEAAESWRIALLRGPATGNRARYAQRVALTAVELGGLPETTADGRRFDEMSQADLEAVLVQNAQAVRAILAEAAAVEKLSPADRAAYEDRIRPLQEDFFAAAMQHVIEGYPTRETAFQNGFAPMIFHRSEWRVP